MRSDQEIFITGLVSRYRHQLVRKGMDLVQQGQDACTEEGTSIGTAIFHHLLDGCFLTLAYSLKVDHHICILDWRFTDPACN